MSIEEILTKLVTAVEANTAALGVLNAGRDAALAKLEDAAANGVVSKPATTRTRKAKEPEVVAAPAAPVVGDDDLRAAAGAYIGSAGEDKEARQALARNLKAITDHFGTSTLVGETGLKDPDQKAQALFYIQRFGKGLTVDFGADYDFAGDPAQGGSEPAAAEEEDEFAIG